MLFWCRYPEFLTPTPFSFHSHGISFFACQRGKNVGRLESAFQSHIILRLRDLIEPDGYVLCLDGNYIQGFPDILILYIDRWAALECKRNQNAHIEPNQRYYITHLNELAFAAFICPENEEEVINDLHKALRIR